MGSVSQLTDTMKYVVTILYTLSGVWSGTTLRRTSVQLSKPSDATYGTRPVGTQLTVQDLWDNPAADADFCNLDN